MAHKYHLSLFVPVTDGFLLEGFMTGPMGEGHLVGYDQTPAADLEASEGNRSRSASFSHHSSIALFQVSDLVVEDHNLPLGGAVLPKPSVMPLQCEGNMASVSEVPAVHLKSGEMSCLINQVS